MAEHEQALENVGLIIDRLDNLDVAAALPLDPSLHLRALRAALPELRRDLKSAYLALGGDDVWG